jgi:predicted nucleic acid-binding protein
MAGRAGRPITRAAAFWDASALIPLCVRQSLTARAVVFYKSYEVVIWWATPVEIASALARLLRMKQLNARDWEQSRRLAGDLANTWSVIQPADVVKARAMQFVQSYDLRAADALQLAAAMEWCEGEPGGRTFLAADVKLREAAALSGFDAKPI